MDRRPADTSSTSFNDRADEKPGFVASDEDGVRIEATKFVPSDDSQSSSALTRWHFVIGFFVAAAVFVFWFLFTSKSVQLRFTPAASEVTVSPGFAFELGGVHLLREGDYVVTARADLHEPMAQTISIGSERNQVIELVFTPLPGFLNLALTPADASVTIDGTAVTTDGLIELAAGQHELLVEHPRYLPAAQVVDMQGKQIEQALSIELAPNWSDVSVTSTPDGAEIWVDNERLPLSTPATVEALAGEREIRVQLSGYKAHRERIFAQAGVAMTLEPITLVQADAQLEVTSVPAGAGVTVNGRFVGKTPLQLDLKSDQQRLSAIPGRHGCAKIHRVSERPCVTPSRSHSV